MGIVHEAEDSTTGARVAIKRMLAEGAELSRFRREMELLAEIDHPGLVRHIAHGTSEDGTPYLAMEWLEGEDLSTRLARGPLTRDETVQVGLLLADALGALHARSVIHRDVKPANVFLAGRGIAGLRLLDLGVARAQHAATALTAAGTALGTPAYMAPEQARGESVDATADVFAAGCVLWECLVGHAAFQGDHALAVLMKVLVEEPRSADELGVADPALAAVVARAMSKSARERHANGSALRDALERLRADSFVPPPRAAVVGTAERRIVSLAMTAGVEATEATLLPSERTDLETSARDAVSLQGGLLQVLVNGAMIAVPARHAAPTDQAACAARCALALAAVSSEAPVALVTGLAVVAGRVPVGVAIDIAV
jgi:serine/threonine protein kinase